MYYHSFPHAPTELVSGISAAAQIPSIVGAYVGTWDDSLYLDIFQCEDFRLKASHLEIIAEVCGVSLEEMVVGPGIDDDHMSVTLETTCFDFSDMKDVRTKPVSILFEVDSDGPERLKRVLDRIREEIRKLTPNG